MFVIGIDVGTTNVKLGVFDESLECIHFASRPTPKGENPSLGDVLRFDELIGVLKTLVNEIPGDVRSSVKAIGISSLGETVFPVGRDGVLSDGMIWYSGKTKGIFEEIVGKLGRDVIFEKTGINPSWIFSVYKIAHHYTVSPELLKVDHVWLDVSSAIAFYLTGDRRMDKSLSSRTQMVNILTGDWDREIIEAAGIPDGVFPEIAPCGEVRGEVKREIAGELGLGSGVVVTTAGHDHVTAAYAFGVVGSEKILNSSGTTETLIWGVGKETLEKLLKSDIRDLQAGFHVEDGRYYILGGIPTGAFCLEWFSRKFLGGDFERLKHLKHVENEVFFFPFLRKAFSDKRYGASFVNLEDSDGIETVYSALIEGVAFEMRIFQEEFFELGLPREHEVIAVGGGSGIDEFTAVKSSVLDAPIRVPVFKEGVTLGSAMIAAESIGLKFPPPDRFESTFHPENIEYFHRKFSEYLGIRKTLYG